METLKVNEQLEYQFNYDDEFEGRKFISIKKRRSFKGVNRWQIITISYENWDKFCDWMEEIIKKYKKKEIVPF